jgi:FlaA1/EpsC-like NDP-sugar epimerase
LQQFLSLTLAAAGLFRRPGAYCWSIRVAQLILFAAAGMTAFQLRFEFSIPHAMLPALWSAIALWVGVKAAVFHGLGLGRGLWRYFSTPDLTRVAAGNVLGSAIAAAVSLIAPVGIPRSVLVLDFCSACC